MNDIELARKVLKQEDLALVVVKNGEIVFKSKDKGIKPMYILATEVKELSKGGSLADRVIGKGAALLCRYIGIEEVYTELISEGGINTLEKYKIPYIMEKSCPYIKNRDKTGYCPIEKLSLDIDNPEILLDKIKEFFKSVEK
ncbi:DUF1893 domain-containing protein [Tissierella pigra]|uniref:DUF1893 domain-containing protein n=1 Tax=Tissierella pigra TaxID=2607614 RepID=A0A6N7XU23_9FIRM|nr:DUF1893 domain-containing protein [Tissierella pigra]MBU5427376.1 DUF1893 domain-containing protein [Tissierella pigra]MSU00923.1 DUF1893 domain-containing protein [Tissierella pigra]